MKIICTHQTRKLPDIWDYEALLSMLEDSDNMYNVKGDPDALTIEWDNPTPEGKYNSIEEIPEHFRREEDFFYLEVKDPSEGAR